VNRFAKSLTTFRDGIEPGAASAARGQGAERPFLFDESLSTFIDSMKSGAFGRAAQKRTASFLL
jgi:hypothetical protein